MSEMSTNYIELLPTPVQRERIRRTIAAVANVYRETINFIELVIECSGSPPSKTTCFANYNDIKSEHVELGDCDAAALRIAVADAYMNYMNGPPMYRKNTFYRTPFHPEQFRKADQIVLLPKIGLIKAVYPSNFPDEPVADHLIVFTDHNEKFFCKLILE